MGNCLYLECLTGISGDMTAAALLDLGADREALERALASLPVDGFAVRISRVKKSGLNLVILTCCWMRNMKTMTTIWNTFMEAQEMPISIQICAWP